MFKKITFYFLTCTFVFLWGQTFADETQKSVLVLNMENTEKLPRGFRTPKDPFTNTEGPLPSREGFDQLRISGSAQFSEKSLQKMLQTLNHPRNFYIVDLREENHGYLNGAAVSWYGVKDWENVGKSLREIEKEEQRRLNQALKQKEIIVTTDLFKDPNGEKYPEGTPSLFTVYSASTEKQIAAKNRVKYIRIPVSDHVHPSNGSVDRFITFVKRIPENHWLHMHCSAGVGRTSTFMVMYDMMKNAKHVSADDIFERQKLIGGHDLREVSDIHWKVFTIKERGRFLRKFYEYCRTNQDNFETSWSLYVLLHPDDSGNR